MHRSFLRLAAVFAASLALVIAPLAIGPVPSASAAVTVTDWDALRAAFEAGGTETIVLAADITSPTTQGLALEAGDDITLDLNGHGLTVGNPSNATGAYGAGVGVPQGAVLTIRDSADDTGHLVSYGGERSAGIGGTFEGAPNTSVGTVTIEGGQVTAVGGRIGAGIGSGSAGAAGQLTISGGVVAATGGQSSAGIGGGGANPADGSVLITGGAVTALGGDVTAAGIGGGNLGDGIDTTIIGGVVTATGLGYGAGIGGGRWGVGAAVTLSGGQIDATGGSNGAAIGSGGVDNGPPFGDPGELVIIGTARSSLRRFHAARHV